ncbi:uncharacterized protein LOC123665374 [Melitaea cinxia]|uniref:uncharacterized protein LOC123665374 n=1 Tax=Melitaea cinxia TaxID=113334 RepID=UPI001E271E17|nr:uncharacterized protein LOC123665374 [Melitaea cinxia]
MNTHFKKKAKRKWTWQSPDGHTLNEIDYIISKTSDICSVQNSEVNKTSHPTDHRMVRATLSICKTEPKSRKTYRNRQSGYLPIECDHLKNSFIDLLKPSENTNDIQQTYTSLIHTIQKNVSMLPKADKTRAQWAITEDIKKLITEKTKLEEKSIKTQYYKKRLKNLYKKIRKRIKTNKENYKLQIFEEELERRSSVKRGNKRLNSSKECKLTVQECEIRQAIQSLKPMKSPGEDFITNETMKVIIEPITPMLTRLFNDIMNQGKIPEE